MAIPQKLVDELLVRCGRRCCICRRFEPTHMYVHHIVPVSQGGTNDADNLMATCVTCHTDVHAGTTLTRRFTHDELRGHREALFRKLASDPLPSGQAEGAGISDLIAMVVSALGGETEAKTDLGQELSPGAIGMLLRAVAEDGQIADMSASSQMGSTGEEARRLSAQKAMLEKLETHDLVSRISGILYRVTDKGFLLADEVLASGANDDSQEP